MNIIHDKMEPGVFSPGIYDCYSNSEYHAHEAVSKSGLDLIHQTPMHYRESLLRGTEETPAMKFGSAFHAAILEPQVFSDTYDEVPGDRRLKAVREAIKDKEAAGKIILSTDDYERIAQMRYALLDTKIGAVLRKAPMKEHSVFAEVDGVKVKCRPDACVPDKRIIFDLKTTADASPEAFAKSVARYRYHVQDAFYRLVVAQAAGINADDLAFVFVAVETAPPYGIAFYTLDDAAKLQGWVEAREDLRTYRAAAEKNEWRGYSPKIETLSLPRWAMAMD